MGKRFNRIIIIMTCIIVLCGFKSKINNIDRDKDDDSIVNPLYKILLNNNESVEGVKKYIIPYENKSKKTLGGSVYPATYDLRDVDGTSYISPIKKTSLDLTYSFAINNSIESNMLMNSQGLKNFSENYYNYKALYEASSSIDFEFGDNNYFASELFMDSFGPVTEEKFGSYFTEYQPKTIAEIYSDNLREYDVVDYTLFDFIDFEYLYEIETISNIKAIVSNYTSLIKKHIINNGSVIAPTSENSSCFNSETDLVYCDKINYVNDKPHFVNIIGWNDTDYSVTDVYSNNLPGAWLVEETKEGKKDYYYVSYYDAYYTMETSGINKVVNSTWDNIYSYEEPEDYDYSDNSTVFNKYSDYDETINYVKIESQNSEEITTIVKIYGSTLSGETYLIDSTPSATKEIVLHKGINYVEFNNEIIKGNLFKIELTDTDEYYLYSSAYTTNTNNDPKLYNVDLNETSLLNIVGDSIAGAGYIKNYDAGTPYTIQILNGAKDITDLFDISKEDIYKRRFLFNIKLKESIEESDNLTFKFVIGEEEKTYNITLEKTSITGKGTEENPYLLKSPSDLRYLDGGTGYYKLNNNIDLEVDTSYKNGSFVEREYSYYNANRYLYWNLSLDFFGTLDGDGHTISDLYSNFYGFFNKIDGATIKNLKLDNFKIDYSSGVLCDYSINSTITNVEISNSTVNGFEGASALALVVMGGNITNNRIINNKIHAYEFAGALAAEAYNSFLALNDDKTYDINISNNVVINNDIYVELSDDYEEDGIEPIVKVGYLIGEMNYYRDVGEIQEYSSVNISNNYYDDSNTSNSSDYYYGSGTNPFGNLNSVIEDLSQLSYEPTEEDILLTNTGNVLLTNETMKDSETYSALDFTDTWSKEVNEIPQLKVFELDPEMIEPIILYNNVSVSEKHLYLNPGILGSAFMESVTVPIGIIKQIYDNDGTELTSDEVVSTGMIVIASNGKTNRKVVIVVPGDATGEGKINIGDVTKAADVSISGDFEKLINNPYESVAMDVNYDGRINVADVTKIADYVLDNNINLFKESED